MELVRLLGSMAPRRPVAPRRATSSPAAYPLVVRIAAKVAGMFQRFGAVGNPRLGTATLRRTGPFL